MLKKYFLFVLFPFSLIAQDNFSLLDKSDMTTSILYVRLFKVANLAEAPEKINASYFIQAYSELNRGDYEDNFGNLSAQMNAKNKNYCSQNKWCGPKAKITP